MHVKRDLRKKEDKKIFATYKKKKMSLKCIFLMSLCQHRNIREDKNRKEFYEIVCTNEYSDSTN